MAFDINDADYNVLFSGIATDAYTPSNQIPEPGALWLVLIATGCLGIARVKRRRVGRSVAFELAGAAA